MPAVALTDHGSLAGAVELFKEAGKQGVKPLIGCEVYVADDRRAQPKGYAHLTLLAETNEGYANLIKLSLARLPRGLLLQAARRLGAARAARDGPGRALRLPLGPRLQGARGEPAADAEAELDRLAQISAATTSTSSSRTRASTCRSGSTRSSLELAAQAGLPLVATGDVHYLDAPTRAAHEALLCIQSGDSLKNPNHWRFETNEFYFKTPDEMALDFPGHEDALRRTLEVAERCNVEIELGRILLPKFPTPDGRDAFDYLVELCEKGLAAALRHGDARAHGAAPVRAQDDPRDGLRRLLPDRLGLHRLRQAERHQRRPGPRLGGRLARRLLPRDHRHRPDPLRPALRALPQPGPQVDARHGHRLRRRRPRARHQLRGREVRPRPRRADHHLLDDGRARRRPRRRARARDPVRRRRQDREADPGRAGPDARRVPQAGRRAASSRTTPTRSRRRSSTSRKPLEGLRAPGLDPRRRRRDRRRAADRTSCRCSRRAPTRRS